MAQIKIQILNKKKHTRMLEAHLEGIVVSKVINESISVFVFSSGEWSRRPTVQYTSKLLLNSFLNWCLEAR